MNSPDGILGVLCCFSLMVIGELREALRAAQCSDNFHIHLFRESFLNFVLPAATNFCHPRCKCVKGEIRKEEPLLRGIEDGRRI